MERIPRDIETDDKITIKKIWFEKNRIYMKANNGEIFSRPLEVFPILKEATPDQRQYFKIGKDKTDVRWESLDEDIHINSFFETAEPDEDNSIANTLRRFPQINLSALAVQIGIHRTLLAKYISGIKKPSIKRKKEIEKALHLLGSELLEVEL